MESREIEKRSLAALPLYGELLMDADNQMETLVACSSKLRQQGKYGEATLMIRRALLREPENAELLNLLGKIEIAQKEYPTAIRTFHLALKRNPDCANAHYNLAWALVDYGQSQESIIEFSAALSLNPEDAICRLNLADQLINNNRLVEALSQYEEGIHIHPDDARFYIGKAIILYQINDQLPENERDWQSVREAFATATDLAPQEPEMFYGLGKSETYLKNYRTAEQAFKTAIDFDPTQEHYYAGLAIVQYKTWKLFAWCRTVWQYCKLKVKMQNDLEKQE